MTNKYTENNIFLHAVKDMLDTISPASSEENLEPEDYEMESKSTALSKQFKDEAYNLTVLSDLDPQEKELFFANCPPLSKDWYQFDLTSILSVISANPIKKIYKYDNGVIVHKDNVYKVSLTPQAEETRLDILFWSYIDQLIPNALKAVDVVNKELSAIFMKELAVSLRFVERSTWDKLDAITDVVNQILDKKLSEYHTLARDKVNIQKLNYYQSKLASKIKYTVISEAICNNLYGQISGGKVKSNNILNSFIGYKSLLWKCIDLYFYQNISKPEDQIVSQFLELVPFDLDALIVKCIHAGQG